MKSKLIIAVIILLFIGVILFVVLSRNSQDNRSHAADEQIQSNLTLQKGDVTMHVNPGTGPIGSTVTVTVTTHKALPQATLRFIDDEGNRATTEIKMNTIQPTQNADHTVTYNLSYTIPATSVVEEDNDNEKAEPITIGTGRFVFNYNDNQSPQALTDTQKLLQVPFTLTK